MSSPGISRMACQEGTCSESTEPLAGLGSERPAKASGISRSAAKSRCVGKWGGWGRVSDDGSGQHNPDRSEGPWGKATSVACTVVLHRADRSDSERGNGTAAESTKDGSKLRVMADAGRPRLRGRP
jgi:hypothetical protein